MRGAAWGGNLCLVERQRDDLMASEIAHITEVDHQIVARLPLQIEGEVNRVGEFVSAVVVTESKRLGSVDDAGGVGQKVSEVGGAGAGGGSEGTGTPGLRKIIGQGVAVDRGIGAETTDGNVVVVQEAGIAVRGCGVGASLRGDKRGCLADSEGTAGYLAGGVAWGEVRVKLTAVIVKAGAATDDKLIVELRGLPRKAQTGCNAPLATGESGITDALGSVDVIAGNNKAGVGNGVGPGVVTIGRRIEVINASVFLSQTTVPVVTDAGSDGEIGPYLVFVLQIKAGLIRAVIAVGVSLQEVSGHETVGGVGRNPVHSIGGKVGSRDSALACAQVADIELRVRPGAAEGDGMDAFGPDGVGRRLEAVLKDAGKGALVGRTRSDIQHLLGKALTGTVVTERIDNRDARKIGAKGGGHGGERCSTLPRRPGLLVGAVGLLSEDTKGLGEAEVRPEALDVRDGGHLRSGVHVLGESGHARGSVG